MTTAATANHVEALNLPDRNAVVERLRASLEDMEQKDYVAGIRCGRVWAADDADAADLKRLDHQRNLSRGDWDRTFLQVQTQPDHMFLAIISDDEDVDSSRVDAFWDDRWSGSTPPAHFVQGFAEGALDVWDDVSGDL